MGRAEGFTYGTGPLIHHRRTGRGGGINILRTYCTYFLILITVLSQLLLGLENMCAIFDWGGGGGGFLLLLFNRRNSESPVRTLNVAVFFSWGKKIEKDKKKKQKTKMDA